ncbi:MAG: hypothetical protein QXL51_08220 [Candidatus Aenigmatarchaeota archaeon]
MAEKINERKEKNEDFIADFINLIDKMKDMARDGKIDKDFNEAIEKMKEVMRGKEKMEKR